MTHHTVFTHKKPIFRNGPRDDQADPAEPPSIAVTKPLPFVTANSPSSHGINPTSDASSERFWRALEASQDRLSLIATLTADYDDISPQFARLVLEIWRSSESPAAKVSEIVEHLKLYRWLRKTQHKQTVDNTVEQMAAFYRFRRLHPEEWQTFENAVAHHQNR